jgi:hypothetical protein
MVYSSFFLLGLSIVQSYLMHYYFVFLTRQDCNRLSNDVVNRVPTCPTGWRYRSIVKGEEKLLVTTCDHQETLEIC